MEDSSRPTSHTIGVAQKTGRAVSWPTFFFVLLVVGVIAFIAGTRSGGVIAWMTGQVHTAPDSLNFSSVQTVYKKLQENYDGSIDADAMIDGAAHGMVAGVGDPYTVFMSAKEAEQFDRDLNGEVSGIGAEIGVRDGQPTILRVIDGSPAQAAGVQGRDIIVSVDGKITDGYDAAKAAEIIRGEAGSKVKLSVKRGEDIKEFTITRAKVSDPSVSGEVVDGIGVMKIRRFDQDTGSLARRTAESFKQQNVRSVVLDLRDNGGGYLDQAQSVAGLWLDNQLVVSERRGGKETDKLNSTGTPVLKGTKTVILVNGSSASASEIVAGALKDHTVATLVGEKTFGKGSVQQIFDLDGGRKLKVTVARWYTPNGINITEKGIEPDQKIELTTKDMDASRDPQMDAAKKAL